jgi:acyl-CoA reductase-like NAD-dependent aldehyde dehydrogenase
MATVAPQVYRNFVNGQWVEARSKETMSSINPATGETLGVVPKAGREDVVAAVEAGKAAYATWRKVPAPRRAEILYRAAGSPKGRPGPPDDPGAREGPPGGPG